MNLIFNLLTISAVVLSEDVCLYQRCDCSKTHAEVHCDSKQLTNLTDLEFPSNVVTLSFVDNKLKFDSIDDRSKIENLSKLTDLSLNQNPLGIIPPFNNSKIRSISLQDTSLISAEFPSTYFGSLLQKISLTNNKIRSINENDFIYLKNSQVKRLHIDSASISIIDQNAFNPLARLQSLSLQNNLLKSCEFLTTFRLLSSIKFDGNQFTSLPQQLSVPNDIKEYFFTHNLISIIDQSSPLYTWMTKNYTNIKIYLANNPFDCCQSLWFIRFLKISSKFIGDAQLLTCVQPVDYAGQFLMKLDPDKMNCGEIPPSKSWWTTGRIIGVSIGGFVVVLVLILGVIFFAYQRRSRSGYTEIGGTDDPTPTAPPLPSTHLPFPPYGEENDGDGGISEYSTAFVGQTSGSQAPTASGLSVIDENRT